MRKLLSLVGCVLLSSTMVIACGDDDDDKKATGGTGGGGTGGATGGAGGATGGAGGATGGAGGATGGAGGALPTGQIDRAGRPAISTALIAAANKDAYNQAAPPWTSFATEIETSLDTIDGLDGDKTNGLLAATRSVLAGVIADDQLQIDLTLADCDGAYLALELGTANKCGGRTLDQDVIDTTLQSLVDATATTKVSDDVGTNDKAFTDDFPYLAAPH